MPRWRTNRNRNADWKSPTFFSLSIVGYSKLRTNEQSAHIEKLREIVRARPSNSAPLKPKESCCGCRPVTAARSPSATTQRHLLCAEEIAKALKSDPEIRVRMGIHSGPVNEVTDLNEQANIAGAGINIAQRVMDCGDAGHILVSKHAAEDLEQYDEWQPYFMISANVKANMANACTW